MSDYYNCDDHGRPSKYSINYKTWVTVFIVCVIMQLGKYYFRKGVHYFMINGPLSGYTELVTRITYNIWRRGTDVFIIIWQLYGNFIYYEWRGKTEDSQEEFD